MNLKQHNDIVQKLLDEIEQKDKEIKKLNKEMTALQKSSSTAQIKSKVPPPSQIQKEVQRRISQLTKEHNAKLAQLNQQIKSLTQENNDLKQRLALKSNLDHKEKEHIAQVIKKNIDRKPGSQHDIKITSLVSHYEAELNKKNTYIQTLKRQVKSISMNQAPNESGKKGQLIETKVSELDECQDEQHDGYNSRKTVPLLEHNQEVGKLQKAIKSLEQKQQQKTSELSDLRNKYNELTKEYYRVLNEYGIEAVSVANSKNKFATNQTKSQKPLQTPTTQLKASQLSKSSKAIKDSRISFNLTDDQEQDLPRTINILPSMADPNDASISLDFEENFKKFSQRPKLFPEPQDDQSSDSAILQQQSLAISSKTTTMNFQKQKVFTKPTNPHLIQSILDLLTLTEQDQIIPELNSLLTKNSFTSLNEQIIKSLHEIMYQFGMGKVSRSQMPHSLEVFAAKCSSWLQSHDLINQICIQLGAKKNKLSQKIAYYKTSELQHLQKMKNITFLTQLNKSHKLLEFINFFELDKSDLQLPQQLKNIYQQLKYVDKFVKQAHMTMELSERKPFEEILQLILRKLETYHSWQLELRKQNQRKTMNKTNKSSVMNPDKA